MLTIKMESSTRNYIYRLLENYKENLKYGSLPASRLQREYEHIEIAMKNLMGEAPKVALNKNQSLTNFIESDD